MHSVFGCKSDKANWMHRHALLSWLCILAYIAAGMNVVHTQISGPAEQLCACHTMVHTLVWAARGSQHQAKLIQFFPWALMHWQSPTAFLRSHQAHQQDATAAMLLAALVMPASDTYSASMDLAIAFSTSPSSETTNFVVAVLRLIAKNWTEWFCLNQMALLLQIKCTQDVPVQFIFMCITN